MIPTQPSPSVCKLAYHTGAAQVPREASQQSDRARAGEQGPRGTPLLHQPPKEGTLSQGQGVHGRAAITLQVKG